MGRLFVISIIPFLSVLFASGCDTPSANGKKLCQCWEVVIQGGFSKSEQAHCKELEERLNRKYSDKPEDLKRRKEVTAACMESMDFKGRAKRKVVLVN